MALRIQIDREDTTPLYQQIAGQLRNQISTGQLPNGTRLPPVRELANRLGVNRITAHNAYGELQSGGWIESTVGKGTFVASEARPVALLQTLGENAGASAVLNDILPIRQMPALRSLAYAEPDPAYAPVDEFWGMLNIVRRERSSMLFYDNPQGDARLRVELARFVGDRGITAMPDDVMVTNGAMQMLSLASRVLASPGDDVLVEQPTYLGVFHMMKMQGLNPISVPWDDEGPRLDVIEHALKTRNPRYFYTVPYFNNPTGKAVSPTRRRELLDLAARYRLRIIEDDVYGFFGYDGPPPHALKADDPDDLIVYVSSFSKLVMPGLRVGWGILPASMFNNVLSLRRSDDMYGPSWVQRALAYYIQLGRLKGHIKRVIGIYRERRDAIVTALDRYMPPGVTWTYPAGGFSTWVTLPNDNMHQVYRRALEHSIAFTPGDAFMVPPGTNRHLRLCFVSQTPAELHNVIAILGDLIANTEVNTAADDTLDDVWTSLA